MLLSHGPGRIERWPLLHIAAEVLRVFEIPLQQNQTFARVLPRSQ